MIDPISMFTKTAGDALEQTGNAIDKVVTSDEERLKLRNELADIQAKTEDKILDMHMAINEGISNRWASDMQSDSWLAKNIRPLVLVFVTLATFVLIAISMVVDLSEQQVRAMEAWSNVVLGMNVTVYGAYFGGRSYEKGKQVYATVKENGLNRELIELFRRSKR